ncbi:MAG: hypothetical protein CMN76_12445 [Spirochaetaceae bacterium]|nr:hypothetical protein [Spirochaetaceae bacterium]|tara:strand:- start:54595 stop:55707 length:1113 start_codon:yes stop_codon:yes gene_type:complete
MNRIKIFAIAAVSVAGLALNCQTKGPDIIKDYPDYSSEINLNNIGMQPLGAANNNSQIIEIRKNSEGNPVALLELDYKNSGLNVIQEIKNGKILEHNIVIMDAQGREIGRAPINFIAFEVEEITSSVQSQKLLFTDSGSEVEYDKSDRPEPQPLERRARLKVYEDGARVPQYVELKRSPASGSTVSIYLELVYIQPFYSELCASGDKDCPSVEKVAFKQIEKDNQETLTEIEDKVNKTLQRSGEGNEAEVVALESDALVFRLKKPVEEYKEGIQREIKKLNKRPTNNEDNDPYVNYTARGGDYLHYREWKLLTVPRYFQIKNESSQPVQPGVEEGSDSYMEDLDSGKDSADPGDNTESADSSDPEEMQSN